MAESLELNYLGSFDTPDVPSPVGPRLTLQHTGGPVAYHDGRLLIVGNRYRDSAWFKIPEFGGMAEIDGAWFDITFGKLEKYIAELKEKTHKDVQFSIRSLVFDEAGLLHWSLSAWYNVSGGNFLTLGVSDLKQQKSYGMWGSSQYGSLEWGGYLSPLSQELQAATGCRYGTAETASSGSAGSNAGPALFVYNEPPRAAPHGSLIDSRPILRYPRNEGKSYPKFHQSWWVSALVDLPGHTLWIGRKGTGQKGYGHLEDMEFNSTCKAAKGYHSEGYLPIIWVADHASLLAGKPKWIEWELSKRAKTPCARVTGTYDPSSGKLYVLEGKGRADLFPIIHVFDTASVKSAD